MRLEEQSVAVMDEGRLRDDRDQDSFKFRLWNGVYNTKAWDLGEALGNLLESQEVPQYDKANYRCCRFVLEVRLAEEEQDG
jgi:hypothetical protein